MYAHENQNLYVFRFELTQELISLRLQCRLLDLRLHRILDVHR